MPNSGGSISPGLGTLGNYNDSFNLFDRVLSSIIGFMTVIAGIWFIFLIITGGIAIMNAGGDKGGIEEAKKKITTGLIGLVIVVAGVFIADLIGNFLGLSLLSPSEVIRTLVP